MDANIQRTISEYFRTQPVEKAWVFGSFSRGEETSDSDVDIIVTLVPGSHMGIKFFGMIVDLEKLLDRPVDLAVEGNLLPFAVKSADKDKILVYERAS